MKCAEFIGKARNSGQNPSPFAHIALVAAGENGAETASGECEHGDSMAKTNQANGLADAPNPDYDPISELSHIVKFGPVGKADAEFQIDMENELMGEMSIVENEEAAAEEITAKAPSADTSVIPGLEDLPPRGEKSPLAEAAGVEPVENSAEDDGIDGAFDDAIARSLDEPVADEPSVPDELENQLNNLLAGLGSRDSEAQAELETDVAAADEVTSGSEPVESPVDESPETRVEAVVPSPRDDNVGDAGASAEPRDTEMADDPMKALAQLTGEVASDGVASEDTSADIASSQAAADDDEPAPLVETADISDEVVPVEGDLEIPEVTFESDVPEPPHFEDLDEDFKEAFNKITDFDRFEYEATAKEPDPNAGERFDNTFDGKNRKIGSGSEVGAAGALRTAAGANGRANREQQEYPRDETPHADGFDPDQNLDIPAVDTGEHDGGARRGIMIAMIVAAIAVAGGIGAFALSFGGGETAAPAVIKADNGPIKVKPEDPGGKTVPNEDRKVYEQVAGATRTERLTQEKLILTEEEPIDVGGDVNIPRVASSDPAASGTQAELAPVDKPDSAVPAGKNDGSILLETGRFAGAPVEEPVVVKPRRVKTLIVKPDGTLVPREEPAAAAGVTNGLRAAADATAETTADTAGTTVETENAAEAASTTGENKSTEVAAVPADQNNAEVDREVTLRSPADNEAAGDGGSTSSGKTEGVVETEGIPFPAPAPRAEFEVRQAAAVATEAQRGERAVAEAGQQAETQTAATDAETAAETPAPAANPEWWVQISSRSSRALAQTSYADMADRYGSIIGGRDVNIVRADIEGKGTYYRVRIAGGNRSEAGRLCSRLKNAGANCFIAR